MDNIVGSTDFRMQHFSIRELMYRMGDAQLIIQRETGKKWGTGKQIRFIESVLCGIPIASLYFDGSKPQWTVLDGVERLYAIKRFLNNEFPMRSLQLLSLDYENRFFNDFPPAVRRRFLNASVIGYVLTTELPKEVLRNIFERLNGE